MTRLLVMHLGSRGAGPRMLHDFAEAAARSGRCETSLAYYGGAELSPDLHALGRPELVAPSATASGALALLQRLVSNLAFARSLRRFARHQDVDAAYAVMDNPLQILPTLALRAAGIPVLGSAHDADRHAGEESPVMEAIMWMRPHLYTGLMTYSGAVASLMRARVRHPDRVFNTVHGAYGGDAATGTPRAAAPVPTRVGFFGRILRYKGIDRLADAVALLRAEGRAVELAVHGRGEIDADLAGRLRRAEAEVDNRWVEDREVADLVASFDIVAIPYSEASQSGIVGYAMNAGVPIVATPLPGLVEQVEVPGVGITATDLQVESFAAALARVIDDEELYGSLSARGPIAARTRFGWSQVVDDVLAATDALRSAADAGVLASWRRRLVRSPASRSALASMTSRTTLPSPIGLYIPFASGSLADEAVIQGTVGFGEAIGRPARVHLHNARRRWRCADAEDHYVHHRRLTGISRRDIRRALRAGNPTHVLILMNDTFDGQWGISHTHHALTVGRVALEEGIRPIICNISVQDEPLQPFVDAVRDLSPDIHVVARDARSAATLSRLLERSVDAVPDIATFMRPAPSTREGRDEHEVILVPNQHQSALFDRPGDVAERYAVIADGLARSGRAVRVMPHDLRDHVGDERLAADVVARSASPAITFYRPESTAEAKASIASAGALVAGRLHACLAGLSTRTPTVGLGYMGKFEMQFAWFQVEGNVLDLRDLPSAADVAELLVPLFDNVPRPVNLEDYRPLIDLLA